MTVIRNLRTIECDDAYRGCLLWPDGTETHAKNCPVGVAQCELRALPAHVASNRSLHTERVAAEMGLTLPPEATDQVRAERIIPGTGARVLPRPPWADLDCLVDLAQPKLLGSWTDHVSPEVMERVFRENSYVAILQERTLRHAAGMVDRRYGSQPSDVPAVADTLDPIKREANRGAVVARQRQAEQARLTEQMRAAYAEIEQDHPRPEWEHILAHGHPALTRRAGCAARQARRRTATEARKTEGWRPKIVRRMKTCGMECWSCDEFHWHISVEEGTGPVLGHLLAHSEGGGGQAFNMAVVCKRCDHKMGTSDWRGKIPSVADKLRSGALVLG